ncbi:MAG: phytase, partial [Candidatus Hinthialibacter sp.]
MSQIKKYLKPVAVVAILFVLAYLLEKRQNPLSYVNVFSVSPVVETQPDTALEDGDDPCIWIHPTDREKSAIICSDKDQGLAVYDLSGREIQFLHRGQINNVDIRSSFLFENRRIDLIAASNRSTSSIELFTINPETRMLEMLPSDPMKPNFSEIYGLCLYKSPSQKFYAFVTSTKGEIEQWEIFDAQNGKLSGKMVRRLKISSKAEGCVADDQLGLFYLAEEEKG